MSRKIATPFSKAAGLLALHVTMFANSTAWGFAPPIQYKLNVLAPLNGYLNSEAEDVNNAGVVIGRSYSHSALSTVSNTWTNFLPAALPAGNGIAYSINESGHAGGVQVTGSGTQSHAYYYDGTTTHDVHTAPLPSISNHSVALSINNSNQMAGWTFIGNSGSTTGVLWNSGSPTLLGTLGGLESAGYALNNLGQVTGITQSATESRLAFRWTDANGNNASDPGEMIKLPDAGYGAAGQSINDLGEVAGWASTDATNKRRPALWSDPSSLALLPLLPGATEGEALSINMSQEIVGVSSGGVATLWRNNQAYNLNDLIAPGSGYVLTRANSINDHGWIAGVGIIPGQKAIGFVLIPVPEPSAAILILSALAFATIRSREQRLCD